MACIPIFSFLFFFFNFLSYEKHIDTCFVSRICKQIKKDLDHKFHDYLFSFFLLYRTPNFISSLSHSTFFLLSHYYFSLIPCSTFSLFFLSLFPLQFLTFSLHFLTLISISNFSVYFLSLLFLYHLILLSAL